jgi:pyruvate dehydrogenase E2 component (dihydrolipoamide acetyltransferase)
VVQEVTIPDIGDAEDVEVIEVLVAVGDEVGVDDGLIVIESDKASMEVPSPFAGRVESIEVGLGDIVTEGQLIVRLEGDGAQPAEHVERQEAASAAEAPTPAAPVAESAPAVPAAAGRYEVRVPDIGDAEGVEVIEVAVQPGDTVSADDLLVVVESDKASMEIPSPAAGKVLEVPVAVGSPVEEDTLLVVLESPEGAAPGPAEETVAEETVAKPEAAVGDRPDVPGDRPDVPDDGPDVTDDGLDVPDDRPPAREVAETAPERRRDAEKSVYAGPAVRRLARELGVDLTAVNGSGSRGRIVKDDVTAFVKKALTEGGARPGSAIPALPAVDFAKFGPVEAVELSRIRARGAANLHRSWLNVPHVTQHDEADVTDLEAFRKSLTDAETRGVKVTPLAFIMRAAIHALKAFPALNASLTPDARSMILKRYYHIGFAVDTDDGLVVPVVRDADQLGVFDLAARIAELSDSARAGKLTIEELSGGSFSISSLGAIGGTAFTPIVNAPEVAILGVSRLTTRPVWTDESFAPRQLLPLSLSYDHRAINGAEAGRFMVFLTQILEDIRRILL